MSVGPELRPLAGARITGGERGHHQGQQEGQDRRSESEKGKRKQDRAPLHPGWDGLLPAHGFRGSPASGYQRHKALRRGRSRRGSSDTTTGKDSISHSAASAYTTLTRSSQRGASAGSTAPTSLSTQAAGLSKEGSARMHPSSAKRTSGRATVSGWTTLRSSVPISFATDSLRVGSPKLTRR